MADTICFLITLLYRDELLRCSIKVKKSQLDGDCAEYPMEPENRKQLWELLPQHVRECGNTVVEVTELFEVVDYSS